MEYLQSSSYLSAIAQKHSALMGLVKLQKGIENFPHLLVQATAEMINAGVIKNVKHGPT